MKQILSTALMIAAKAHDGQFDKSGLPYLMHVLKVMYYLKTDDEELMAIGVLHDVKEDSPQYSAEIDATMPKRVVDALNLLNHDPAVPYQDYIELIGTNPDAIKVKMCDLRHNMDIRRLKGVTDKDIDRLAKYSRAYNYLKDK